MQALTFEQLITTAVVILVLIGAYNTIMTAVKNHRSEKELKNSPISKLSERIDKHDDMLSRNHDRLDDHEREIREISEESKIMLRGVRALLSHEINGNSDDKLRASMTEIDDYLIGR